MAIRRKRHLAMLLERVPMHPKPDANLEQYRTPADVAAEVLWAARGMSDIRGKNILDLGCGTGILGIGAALLGARKVYAIDIDEDALETAASAASDLELSDKIEFIQADLRAMKANDLLDITGHVDTTLQNPPFGSQERVKKGADRVFMDIAAAVSDVIYSFHMAGSEDFVRSYYEKLGGRVTHRLPIQFPLPRLYSFHKRDVSFVGVVILRVEL